ncbi:MAG: protein translocase subunit SecD [Verrucomicrobia bacterium]|nr:protein translocase subunit SecD [Verrucomicrobiota bacterium]MBU1735381.1 protein translocase subunit SecD [Verrucomicrobiota bacterium]MBU1857464.1 protein translocase subunit SecD [Verrucomicrobiota bacterium]
MDKHALWKWLILIALTAWSLALVVPFRSKVKLGLDLKGGTSFTVQINESEIEKQIREENKDLTDVQVRSRVGTAVQHAQEQAVEIIRNRVDALGVAEPLIYPEKHNRVVVQIPGLKDADRDRAAKLIQSAAFLVFSIVHEDNDKLVSALFEKGLAPEGFQIGQAVSSGRREVYRRDTQKVPDEAMTAEFRAKMERFQAPPGYRFMLEERHEEGQKIYSPYFVKQRYELRGDTLKNAGIEYDQLGQPYVTLKFDSKGARRFARVTADYAPGGAKNPNPEGRRYLAIIMDDRLYSAPFLKTAIYGGEAIIEGNFTLKDAQDLSIVLRAGSLPAPVQIIESRTVDPSLGRDSIESGTRATIYACILVVVFMAVYYMVGGLVANIALLFNMLLLPLGMMITAGIMGLFTGATGAHIGLPVLTLPGIAGIALTIGMAVDANVLIFERIREEQRTGKRLGPALEAGYTKAFITILDSNLTTVMAAVILFMLGTGAVRGFGITLTAGIMVSMYTALIVTRMIFNIIVARTSMFQLKMLSVIKPTNINFIAWRKVAIGISVGLIVLTWGYMVERGMKSMGNLLSTDFTGGSAVTFQFAQKQDVEKIRNALADGGIADAQIQYQKEMDKNVEYLQVRSAFGTGDKIKEILNTRFVSADFKVLSEDAVGPQIGNEMTTNALKAMLYAFIGMLIYIAWRFEFSFSLGAIIAMLHDILICLGIYCIFGRQISATTMAALLTIIGYSINDTIVIYDRIRENMRKYPGRDMIEVCNLSVNETLSRTILTGSSVIMAVLMLLIFGGGAINDFAFLFLVGTITGTFSSVYIATPIMLFMRRMLKKPETGVPAR